MLVFWRLFVEYIRNDFIFEHYIIYVKYLGQIILAGAEYSVSELSLESLEFSTWPTHFIMKSAPIAQSTKSSTIVLDYRKVINQNFSKVLRKYFEKQLPLSWKYFQLSLKNQFEKKAIEMVFQ